MNEAQKARKDALCSGYAFDDETAEEMAVAVDKVKELELQNRDLKRSIWKHLHIKHERTICPLSVGTPERCCEIILRDAGLNPADGEPLQKCAFKVDPSRFGRELCEHVLPCPMHG